MSVAGGGIAARLQLRLAGLLMGHRVWGIVVQIDGCQPYRRALPAVFSGE